MNIEHRSDISPTLWTSVKFFDEHLSDLQQSYSGVWVALAGETVRFANREASEIHKAANANCPNATLLIVYVPAPGEEPLDWK